MLIVPDVAFTLAVLGALLIYFELIRPGMLFPGLAGAALFVWGGYELSRSPIHLWALLPIFGGVLLLLAEIVASTRFVAPALGTVLLGWGCSSLSQDGLHGSVVWPLMIVFAAVSTFLAVSARQARRNKRLDLEQKTRAGA